MPTAQLSDTRELSLHGSLSFLGYDADDKLPREQWVEDGSALVTMDKALRFAIGDWVLFGEQHYGEAHAQAIRVTALSYESINAARWVASRIPEIRRRTNLSWSHHEAVASLDPTLQDELLDRAEREGLDRNQVRELTREVKGLPPIEEMVYVPAEKVRQIERERDEVKQVVARLERVLATPDTDRTTLPTAQLDDLKELARHADLEAQAVYSQKWSDPL